MKNVIIIFGNGHFFSQKLSFLLMSMFSETFPCWKKKLDRTVWQQHQQQTKKYRDSLHGRIFIFSIWITILNFIFNAKKTNWPSFHLFFFIYFTIEICFGKKKFVVMIEKETDAFRHIINENSKQTDRRKKLN